MNHWYFWVLAPVAIASAIIIPLVADPPSVSGHVVVWVVVSLLLLGTLGLADSKRFRWALRSVAALIVVAGLMYFVSELVAWRAGKPLGVFGRRSDRSLWNSGLFLLIFGFPALRYLLSGQSETVVDDIAAAETIDDGSLDDFDGDFGSDHDDRRGSERAG